MHITEQPTVLYVEDDPRVRQMYAMNLRSDGFLVQECIDGIEAWAVLRDATGHDLPDIVLTDIAMPGIDGLELVRRLEIFALHRPVSAFLTSNPSALDEHMLRMTADLYLRKPCDPQRLATVLHQQLGANPRAA